MNPQTSKMRSSEYKVAYRKILRREFTSASQTVLSYLKVKLEGSIALLSVESLDYNYSRGALCHVALRQTYLSIMTTNFLNCNI